MSTNGKEIKKTTERLWRDQQIIGQEKEPVSGAYPGVQRTGYDTRQGQEEVQDDRLCRDMDGGFRAPPVLSQFAVRLRKEGHDGQRSI